MADMQLGNAGGSLAVQAATPVAGFALQNGTPGIISWTAPNDGKQHRFTVLASLNVASGETGGQVTVTYQPPSGGFTPGQQVFAGGLGAGTASGAPVSGIVGPGTTVFVLQATALTAGAATVWAEIWGS